MFDFLALITNKKYWLFHSWMIKAVLKTYGISVGKNFYIEGVPRLKVKGVTCPNFGSVLESKTVPSVKVPV